MRWQTRIVDDDACRGRIAASPVGRLATVRPDGAPHIVPVVFALAGDTIYTAVDAKPKRSPHLQRLANLRREPRCSVLVDHYEDDWSALWWVRADGVGVVIDDPPADHPGLVALADRHPQYRAILPIGPVIAVSVQRWSGWSAKI